MDIEENADQWRNLALQFDGHRIQALGHLKTLIKHPAEHAEAAAKFLTQPPLSGEHVLAERLASMIALAEEPTDKEQPTIDYSIKSGDEVIHPTWTLSKLYVVDVNWALNAVAVRLGPEGSGIVVWPAARLKKAS